MKKKNIKDRIYSTLLSSKSRNRDIFNTKYIESLINDKDISSFSGSSKVYQTSSAHKVWMCYNLETFFSDNE